MSLPLSKEEVCKLTGKLIEEVRLRGYSSETGRSYVSVIKGFLNSGKNARDFLVSCSSKSRSTVRTNYFALKFFYENVLNEEFKEIIPLAKKSFKLPVVLNKEEVTRIIDSTKNLKHKLILMFLYYAGLRLSEVINLKFSDIDFERELIHIRNAKGGKERVVSKEPQVIDWWDSEKQHIPL